MWKLILPGNAAQIGVEKSSEGVKKAHDEAVTAFLWSLNDALGLDACSQAP